VNAVTAYLRGLNPQLPRPVWLLEAGGVANSLGNGIVLPFLIIYLHEVRHFGLASSGAIVSTLGAVALASTPLAGRFVDLVGPRTTLMSSLGLLAVATEAFRSSTTPGRRSDSPPSRASATAASPRAIRACSLP